MTRTALVTGCAGFIGSLLSRNLLDRGFKVVGVDSLIYKNGYALNGLLGPNFEFYRLDIRDPQVYVFAQRADYIYHTAARVGAPICSKDEKLAIEVNQTATQNLVKSLRNQRLVFLTTNSGYGVSEGYCTESSPMNPLSCYGVSKVEAEKAVLDYKNGVSLRLATVFGTSIRPRMDLMVQNFVSELFFFKKLSIFESHFRRNFVGINDVVRACVWMMDDQYSGPYNCGNDSLNMTKLQLAKTIASELEVDPAGITEGVGKDPDGRNYLISNQKLLNTRFEFKQDLRSGVRDIKNLCKIHGMKVHTYSNIYQNPGIND